MKEEWKEIEGYDGLYLISNLGVVKSLRFNKEKIMKTYNKKGYQGIDLRRTVNGKKIIGKCTIHRLVA